MQMQRRHISSRIHMECMMDSGTAEQLWYLQVYQYNTNGTLKMIIGEQWHD